MMEIAIITCDMQEVIGTAIAFYMLSDGKIPLYAGCLITMLDTFVFLFLDKFGVRKLELFFVSLIAIMAITFGYEFVVVQPDFIGILKGIFIPTCGACNSAVVLQIVSIIGSIIQPYSLYLHSALVKRRKIDGTKKSSLIEANFYFFIEAGIVLLCSFLINAIVASVFALGLYNKTNYQIRQSCDKRPGIIERDIFPYNNESIDGNIYSSGVFLGCEYGIPTFYIWGIGVMAAGQSATVAGTYAGQFIMEGLLKIKWPSWKRVLVSRSVALLPTLAIIFFTTKGFGILTDLNNLLNCIQMIQLPFALIPLLTFSSYDKLMGDFKNSKLSVAFTMIVSIAIITISIYFSIEYVVTSIGTQWYMWLVLMISATFYLAFSFYLFIISLNTINLLPHRLSKLVEKLYNHEYGVEMEWQKFIDETPSISSETIYSVPEK
uniref:Natural resistance-associated macrophage protein n=1 Tax=Acrobeloides nanus TaxID=290746 RepID=A0A914CPE6_9BILA